MIETDYAQRSLLDCYSKYHTLSSVPTDWRTVDGLEGCAKFFIPSDQDLERSEEIVKKDGNLGQVVLERPEGWMGWLVTDTRVRESWTARMTLEILKVWQSMGGEYITLCDGKGKRWRWYWEEQGWNEVEQEKDELELDYLYGIRKIEVMEIWKMKIRGKVIDMS